MSFYIIKSKSGEKKKLKIDGGNFNPFSFKKRVDFGLQQITRDKQKQFG